MFNVSCKDPLEAEKIRDRRERKHREIQEGINSIHEAVRRSSASTATPVSQTCGCFSPGLSSKSSRSSLASASSRLMESPKSISIFFQDSFSVKAKSSIRSNSVPATPRGFTTLRQGRLHDIDPSPCTDFFHHDNSSVGSAATAATAATATTTATTATFSRVPSYTNYPIPSQAVPDRETLWHSKHCQRLLRRIEMLNDKATARRLAERWQQDEDNNNNDDENKKMQKMHEFHFETALYALVYTQKMSRRQFLLPSGPPVAPGEEDFYWLPVDLNAAERSKLRSGNILHIGATRGSPESWYLGTKLPDATIHSLGLQDLPFDISSSSCWALPPNVLLEQWPDYPQLDFADGVFDAVILSPPLFQQVRCTVWPQVFAQIARVLGGGGVLIVSTMDVQPRQKQQKQQQQQQQQPEPSSLLNTWIHHDEKIYSSVLKRFMVPCPSLLVPAWAEENGDFNKEDSIQANRCCHFPCMPAVEGAGAGAGAGARYGQVLSSDDNRRKEDGSNGKDRQKIKARKHWVLSPTVWLDNLSQIDEWGESCAGAAGGGTTTTALPPPPPPLLLLLPEQGNEEDQCIASAASLTGWIHYQRMYGDFSNTDSIQHSEAGNGSGKEEDKRLLLDSLRDFHSRYHQYYQGCQQGEQQQQNPVFEMATFVYRRRRRGGSVKNSPQVDGHPSNTHADHTKHPSHDDQDHQDDSGGVGGTNFAKL